MIIRTAANEQEIEQAIQIYWADDPPPNTSEEASGLAHWQALFASSPEGFWIAQDESTHQIVGVASAVRRPPQWMLTNFFVLSAYQGQGIGRMLLSRAFATHEGCDRFLVHASQRPSAQSLYMKFGMYPLPYSIQFRGNPQGRFDAPSALIAENRPIAKILSTLNSFDKAALGFTRAVDHEFWAGQGSYSLVIADNEPVGYFRVSSERRIGPLVVSDVRWMPAALELALRTQWELSPGEQDIFVPGANTTALAYLLDHGFHYRELELLLSSHLMPGMAQVVFHDTDLL